MPKFLGREVTDEFLEHLVDSYLDAYLLAGGEHAPTVGAVLADLRDLVVTTASGASYAGKERARREAEAGAAGG